MIWGMVLSEILETCVVQGLYFPRGLLKLYCLSRSKDSSVAKVMGWFTGRFHWNVQFHHPPQDWEE